MRLPTPPELVAAAKTALGIPPDGKGSDKQLDLALHSKHGVAPGQPLIGKWRRGAGPSFEYAIVLLHVARWLNEAEIQKAAAATKQDAAEDVRGALGMAKELDAQSDDQLPGSQDQETPESETG